VVLLQIQTTYFSTNDSNGLVDLDKQVDGIACMLVADVVDDDMNDAVALEMVGIPYSSTYLHLLQSTADVIHNDVLKQAEEVIPQAYHVPSLFLPSTCLLSKTSIHFQHTSSHSQYSYHLAPYSVHDTFQSHSQTISIHQQN